MSHKAGCLKRKSQFSILARDLTNQSLLLAMQSFERFAQMAALSRKAAVHDRKFEILVLNDRLPQERTLTENQPTSAMRTNQTFKQSTPATAFGSNRPSERSEPKPETGANLKLPGFWFPSSDFQSINNVSCDIWVHKSGKQELLQREMWPCFIQKLNLVLCLCVAI